MTKYLTTFGRYLRTFGLRGLWGFAVLHLPGTGVKRTLLPSLVHPIFLRKGSTDVNVLEQVFLMRDYDLRKLGHWARVKRTYDDHVAQGKRPLILDCGANIGLTAILLSQQFPEATIIAIEPESDNFALLESNVLHYPNIKAVKAGVSNEAAWLKISDPSADSWGFRTEAGGVEEAGAVEAVTIPMLRRMAGDHEFFIVKIDIETFEDQLFSSNTEWLREAAIVMIELHDWMEPWAGSSRNFFKALAKIDFDFVQAGETALIFNWATFNRQVRSESSKTALSM